MGAVSKLVAAAAVAGALAALTGPAVAGCKKMGFLVNDYGKDGPTNDAKSLLDKHIAQWAAEQGIEKYTVGKKDVSCELFLNLIVVDEHTCTASAMVCWGGDKMPASQMDADSTPGGAAKPKTKKADDSQAKKTASDKPATKSAETKTDGSTAAHDKAAADKPAVDKAAEAKPADLKPADLKPAESKPAEAKASDAPPVRVETGALPLTNKPEDNAALRSATPSDVASKTAAEAAAAAAERAAAAAERAADAAERAAAALNSRSANAEAASSSTTVPPIHPTDAAAKP